MAEYTFIKQFANETKVRIETNNRDFFIGIEKAINDFINYFTNENEELTGIELADFNRNENAELKTEGFENTKSVANENELTNRVGFENRNQFANENENELHSPNQNTFKNISGNELQKQPIRLPTKFGTATLGKTDKYFRITSNKEGNINKLLHRLIYEDYYGVTLLDETIIHHIDENKLNNRIDNLVAVSKTEHAYIHKGNPFVNPDKDNEGLRISRNTTGYYGVYKQVCPKCNQGFTWKYTYKEQGILKTIESVNINKLELKVKAKGLPWRKL